MKKNIEVKEQGVEKPIKILWVSDAVAATGFARVAHSIINELPENKYEIHHLGINYFGDPHRYKHRIYPASLGGDVYGLGRIIPLISTLQPDIVMMINDPWVIDMYLGEIKKQIKAIPPIVTYFPVDAREHSPSFYKHFDIVNRVCVYTQFGKDVVLATRSQTITEDKIHIVPHGISTKTFYPINTTMAREALFPEEKLEDFVNSFVVFNGNRNQPRKRIDITMWAFTEFQRNKPDVKLYLHMGVQDLGVNIAELANRYGFDNKLILSTTSDRIPSVFDEQLNVIYNATDVGINTSLGEGWGLVNWEHAATGKLQILPNHSAIKEIWTNNVTAKLLPTVMPQMIERVNTVGEVVDIRALISTLEWAYHDWKYNDSREVNKIAQKGYELTQEPRFSWNSVGKEFDNIFQLALKEK